MQKREPVDELTMKLQKLRAEFEELTRSLPRHGVKASQLIRLEELEDEIAELEKQLPKSDA